MHQGKEKNTQHTNVNKVTNDGNNKKNHNMASQQEIEETQTPTLSYNKKTKQSHMKGKLSRLFMFIIGSIGTQNSIFNSGSTCPFILITCLGIILFL